MKEDAAEKQVRRDHCANRSPDMVIWRRILPSLYFLIKTVISVLPRYHTGPLFHTFLTFLWLHIYWYFILEFCWPEDTGYH